MGLIINLIASILKTIATILTNGYAWTIFFLLIGIFAICKNKGVGAFFIIIALLAFVKMIF